MFGYDFLKSNRVVEGKGVTDADMKTAIEEMKSTVESQKFHQLNVGCTNEDDTDTFDTSSAIKLASGFATAAIAIASL